MLCRLSHHSCRSHTGPGSICSQPAQAECHGRGPGDSAYVNLPLLPRQGEVGQKPVHISSCLWPHCTLAWRLLTTDQLRTQRQPLILPLHAQPHAPPPPPPPSATSLAPSSLLRYKHEVRASGCAAWCSQSCAGGMRASRSLVGAVA